MSSYERLIDIMETFFSICYLYGFRMEACVILCRCVGIPRGAHLGDGCDGNMGDDVAMGACKVLSGDEVGSEVGRFACSVSRWVAGAQVFMFTQWARLGHG